MQYQGFVVAHDNQSEYPPVVLKRASALEYAAAIQSHTLIPVTLPIDNPFINRPEDPFFEPKLLRELGWDDREIYNRLTWHPSIPQQFMNTNFWVDVIQHAHGDNYTPSELFEQDRDSFMELPISTQVFFSLPQNIADVHAKHYDGVVFKGMAALRDSTVVISFRPPALRYGEEERLPL
ncbi:hypothetical protein BIZ78_gp093 [Erwinia phage vB_EamM_Caitlin]|uniref:hypothetical protein n=1 Tax=Erwinia phage vB_EamM_Caitlin TaxID=1883379 RepID=UPI00081D0005|nr:hypothetical protein BIZ78_gp093 [Erwinia phage vB_EamM_Caitlin]ANZ48482.1 hypothetical protein CAITLIN_187 [Erwinia phage vB_EamM_Caitlin]